MIYYENHVYCLLTMTNIYYIFRLMLLLYAEWKTLSLRLVRKRLKAAEIKLKVYDFFGITNMFFFLLRFMSSGFRLNQAENEHFKYMNVNARRF